MQETVEIKVFISCPGDVTGEKEAVIKVCETLNKVFSSPKSFSKYRLFPLDFRDIVAPLNGNPQTEINNRFANYEVYIGIFWMKFGTPTGNTDPRTSRAYLSGTEEEFYEAKRFYEEGKPVTIYLYFKEPIGPGGTKETEQLLAVQRFKDEVRELGWTNSISNNGSLIDITNKTHQFLNEIVRSYENQEKIENKKVFVAGAIYTRGNVSYTSLSFIMDAGDNEELIDRTLIEHSTSKDLFLYFENKEKKNYLTNLVNEENRIVLLGHPGSGKSTELVKLAHHYTSENTPFIPVYKRLNTYVDESIEDYLPKGWNDIPSDVCLIILDGLDEIQPNHFNTAVRKLESFAESNPEIRIVISCRTNFYNLPHDNFSGTLPQFKIYLFNTIQIADIKKYIAEKHQIDEEEFIREIFHKDLDKLFVQPFFLDIILQEYQKEGQLSSNKIRLLDSYIDRRFIADQEHFRLQIDLKSSKVTIIKTLQRVALAMEYLGRNHIDEKELAALISSKEEIELLKHSTAFNTLLNEPTKWTFEHNNIQEFLAAKTLNDLDTEDVKSLVSFNNKILKPSWLNTLFFYISIVEDHKRNNILDWILAIDPEILVKVEPDKVDETVRTSVFERIFNEFKEKDLWIRSTKFTNKELARFSPHDSAQKFLVNEIKKKSNTRIVKLNAVYLLQDFDINEIDENKLIKPLLEYIRENDQDPYIFNATINTFTSLSLINESILNGLFDSFRTRKNQYIRSGFLRAIIDIEVVDKYADYLMECLTLGKKEEDRTDVNLLDESILIKEAFQKLNNIEHIIKAIKTIMSINNRDYTIYYHLQEITEILINKVVEQDQKQSRLFSTLLSIYQNSVSRMDEWYTEALSTYFLKTGNTLKAFEKIFRDNKLNNFEKQTLLSYLTTEDVIYFVVEKYSKHDLTNQDMQDFYFNLKYHANKYGKNKELELFIESAKDKQIEIQDRASEVALVRKKTEEENLRLYFSPSDFRAELQSFFYANNIIDLTWENLWKFNSEAFNQNESSIHQAVFDLLGGFTRSKRTTNLERVLQFVDDTPKFEDYLFSQLAKTVKNRPNITLDEGQLETLQIWVNDRLSKEDVTQAIKVSSEDFDRSTYSRRVDTIWFFVTKYNLKIEEDKLLDFTLFHNWKSNGDSGIDFGFIEKQVGTKRVKAQVLKNIRNGIDFYASWQNNAIYAINKKIIKSYPILISNFSDSTKSIHAKGHVLIEFIQKVGAPQHLLQFINSLPEQDLRWTVVQETFEKEGYEQELIEYLLSVLNDTVVEHDDKLKSSQYLTMLKNDEGIKYYLSHIEEIADSAEFDDYSHTNYIKSITDIKYLTILVEILEKAYLSPNRAYRADSFHTVEGLVSDALYNLGLVSEEYLFHVKAELEKFINRNQTKIDNVNQFYPMIERMEHQFYLAKSQNLTIQDAIKEVDKIMVT